MCFHLVNNKISVILIREKVKRFILLSIKEGILK